MDLPCIERRLSCPQEGPQGRDRLHWAGGRPRQGQDETQTNRSHAGRVERL